MKAKTKKTEICQIKPNMNFAEVIRNHPETVDVFFKNGMSCFGCPAAMMEKLEDGIKAHGQDVKKVMAELNAAVKKKK
jgi:hybrid cluster-associated redox disulfide protein